MQAAAACPPGPPTSFPQHLLYSQAAHSMSAAASAMVPAAQQCSGGAGHSPSTFVRPLSTLTSECSVKSQSCAQQAAQAHRTRLITSSAAAAESMSRDKTDLNAGAAAAAAAQTMQQQPSAHGLQAAPQVAKVLGFAGTALFALSHTFWKGMHACQRWWLQLCPQDSACSLCNGYEGDSVSL